MSWRDRISLALLIALTAVPVSGTVCAMLCDSAAATRAAHHGSGKACDDEKATTPSSGLQVRGASGHDCGDHEASSRVVATTTATRADSVPPPSLVPAVRVRDSFSSLTESDAVFDYRIPLGSTPPTASPLVLRV